MWWRIYYGDGSVFTDADGSPWDAPRVDVQVIAQEKDGDYERVCGRDHYYWEPERGGWCNSDIFGAMDHLIRSHRQCLLFGRQMSDEGYRQVHMRMLKDLPPRKHRYPRENAPE
jgi:hypothetical protein